MAETALSSDLSLDEAIDILRSRRRSISKGRTVNEAANMLTPEEIELLKQPPLSVHTPLASTVGCHDADLEMSKAAKTSGSSLLLRRGSASTPYIHAKSATVTAGTLVVKHSGSAADIRRPGSGDSNQPSPSKKASKTSHLSPKTPSKSKESRSSTSTAEPSSAKTPSDFLSPKTPSKAHQNTKNGARSEPFSPKTPKDLLSPKTPSKLRYNSKMSALSRNTTKSNGATADLSEEIAKIAEEVANYDPSKFARVLSKEARAAYWGMSYVWPEYDDSAVAVSVGQTPRGGRKPEKMELVQQLSRELKLTRESLNSAIEVFERYADSSAYLTDRVLNMTQFSKCLADMCAGGSMEDLSDEFLKEAADSADRDHNREIDVKEFCTWYSSFSFTEDMILSPSAKETRQFARRIGVDILDIERYRREFERFDTDGSGMIELDEFTNLLNVLLKVPRGVELPKDRIQALWREADRSGSGEIDFERFIVFYQKIFEREDGKAFEFEDFYKGIRPCSMRQH